MGKGLGGKKPRFRIRFSAEQTAMTKNSKGTFYGVGVGPGDPELLTLKAFRLIQQAVVISYLSNTEGSSQAKTIARSALADAVSPALEIPILMHMSNDRRLANQAYDQGARAIQEQLNAGQDVVFLCEGDPLFFGSFAYLLERLEDNYCCQVVPGISSVNAAASSLVEPLTLLKESFAVVSGRHSDEQILDTLQTHDAVVIMKAGRARPRILKLLEDCDRTKDARYLEYIGREQEHIEKNVSNLANEAGPYFSLFVVLPNNRHRADSGEQGGE